MNSPIRLRAIASVVAAVVAIVACGSSDGVAPFSGVNSTPDASASSTSSSGAPDGSLDGTTKVDGGSSGVVPGDAGPGPRPKTDAGGAVDAGPCVPIPATVACTGKCGNVDNGCGQTYPCGNSCAPGQLCDQQSNLCISPRAICEDYGADCGLLSNDCGNQLNCGVCTDDIFGKPRECDQATRKCVACPANLGPSLCSQIGFQCGALERCGQTINCGTCPGGNKCDAVSHTCQPVTSPTCAGKCGPISDGNGGILNCPGCPVGQACGVGGVQSVCAPARPSECVALGVECGPLQSQCGGPALQCGTCGNGQVCRANGTCGPPCDPLTCVAAGAQCGFTGDGCGKLLNCGGCPNGGACNPNNNQCCQPLTCAAYPGECGPRSNGCGGTINCNPCGGGQTCLGNGQCCTPKSCSAFPGQCGAISNGCGGAINCGCPGGNSCIGGLCQVCTPRTCAANYPGQCGTFTNGCGGSLTCSCTGNQKCGGGGTPGVCGCLNTTTCPPNFVGPLETCTGTLFCSN
jgi:hypothetical protein